MGTYDQPLPIFPDSELFLYKLLQEHEPTLPHIDRLLRLSSEPLLSSDPRADLMLYHSHDLIPIS